MEEEELIGFGSEPANLISVAKKSKKGGGFQTMGLSFPVLKGVLKRGYKVPTPIQRKTIPIALEGKDVVAMARTGSGKTACFLLPLFEKLKEHSTMGIRAIVLLPTRELAIQTLKFAKELGRFTSLRSVIILGGDSIESQFSLVHSNPDIVIATPGRFLHICIEMELKLNTVQYVVFDEADRLFEMGFSEQLTEIITRLPESRQTLLFSATLPKVLVQFAKAGLNDPVLIRLDVESKIPDTLELAFFHCRPEEREAALLCILKHIIEPTKMTVVFAATKHHVEFLHSMLNHADISNTYIYSDLDACARKINASKFLSGQVSVLVVTDVAARGIDIPQLDYVVNFNFPAKPKLFVHRVGRCARAGRSGRAYSLVTTDELCFLLDLHLFLGRPVNLVTADNEKILTGDGYFGKIPQPLIEEELSALISWNDMNLDVQQLKKVCINGYKNYIKSRPGASKDSVRRAKKLDLQKAGIHPLFQNVFQNESERLNFISKMKHYRPPLTVFEMGQSASSIGSLSMRLFRKINKQSVTNFYRKKEDENENCKNTADINQSESKLESSNAEDIESTFQEVITHRKRKNNKQFSADKSKMPKVDQEHYIPYKPSDSYTERGLVVNDLKSRSSEVILDMTGDTVDMMRTKKRVERRWDPLKRKYVTQNNKEKMVKSESGQWIPVTYKTDRYEKWQEKNKIRAEKEDDSDDDEQPTNKITFKKGSLRPDKHWGRHNLKMQEKYKPLVVNTEHILKQRMIKEKRRERSGRKPTKNKKNKVKKKSSKFNKF